MQAFLLKSGAILYPRRAEGEPGSGVVGDGFDVAEKGSADHEVWDRFVVPASDEFEALAADILRSKAAGDQPEAD